ncbi:5-formyltetrahydrofolate cyclo-ligase [Streptococcus ictaluri]|uniref:5-formyltetrahydrofolate cyclo-ligase n=1 Tax=Streptococcus ictaluri 707-05 TaxID=764299 RepID=G5JZJ4_9STRE|nr:5-formyltetrahydrofolate cyclo-ligase [Streptococcus ictaluri]EHI70765.1 5-formyltetrahydrofolate cyclo-ligase [Streptococcus ictaluri 707-05]
MTKKDYRKQVLEHLKAMPEAEKQSKDKALLEELTKSEAYQKARTIATYLAMPHEYQTQALIEQAIQDKKTVLIPKTYPQGKMIFVPYHLNELMKTAFGLLEPKSDVPFAKEAIDMIHVPGLVFNASGHRIGYGAGYYDRYLADYSGMTVSAIYKSQLRSFEPEDHDVAVSEVYCQ